MGDKKIYIIYGNKAPIETGGMGFCCGRTEGV
jgi:hypothetical protein